MTLRSKITSADELPENLRPLVDSLYTKQEDGSYTLQIEGDAANTGDLKKKNAEFRNTNIELQKKLNEFTAKYGDLSDSDLDELRKLKTQIETNETMQLVRAGRLDEVINKRTQSLKAEADMKIKALQDQLNEREQSLTNKSTKLATMLLDNHFYNLATKLGQPRDGSVEIIQRLARDKFRVDDNDQIVPITAEGDDEGAALTPEAFVKNLAKNRSWLYESSTGAGATGTTSRQSRSNVRRIPNDPELKGRLAKEIAAGTVVVDPTLPVG